MAFAGGWLFNLAKQWRERENPGVPRQFADGMARRDLQPGRHSITTAVPEAETIIMPLITS